MAEQRSMTVPGEGKKITVCLYVSSSRSREALALIDSLLAMPGASTVWDLLVAVDTPTYDVKHIIQKEYQFTNKAVFFESGAALGKAAWWRIMMSNIRSEYALLLDDRARPSAEWFGEIIKFIRDNPEMGIAGFKHEGGASGESQGAHSPLKAGPVLVKTSWYREMEHRPFFKNEEQLPSVSYLPPSMAATLGVFIGGYEPLRISEIFHHNEPTDGGEEPRSPEPLFTICVCSYGNHPELILRCLDSILQDPLNRNEIEILVGCNQVSPEVVREIDRRHRDGYITSIIRSPLNFNKAGMQRFLFRMARAPYVLSLDDDMYFHQGWALSMKKFIQDSAPFDVAGRLHALSNRTLWSGQKKPYDTYCQKKRWWRGKQPYGLEVIFPAGQCFLARRSFVLDNDYPDIDMRIDWDDVLLGDMVTQVDGKQIWFSEDVMRSFVVDDTPSRGQHGSG